MGVYDCFGKHRVQLKTGEPEMRQIDVGSDVQLKDGVYVGYEGVVVILDGCLLATFPFLRDKWGGIVPGVRVKALLNELCPMLRGSGGLE